MALRHINPRTLAHIMEPRWDTPDPYLTRTLNGPAHHVVIEPRFRIEPPLPRWHIAVMALVAALIGFALAVQL